MMTKRKTHDPVMSAGEIHVYGTDSGTYVVAWGGQWLQGSFETPELALESGITQAGGNI